MQNVLQIPFLKTGGNQRHENDSVGTICIKCVFSLTGELCGGTAILGECNPSMFGITMCTSLLCDFDLDAIMGHQEGICGSNNKTSSCCR